MRLKCLSAAAPGSAPRPSRSLLAVTATLLTALATPVAWAQEPSIFDQLLEKLRDKGVLTQEEYDALKAARDEERMEQRAERRKEALKEAQAVEKEDKAREEAKSTLTGRFRDGFTFESGDKQHSISVTGRVQADYRSFSQNSTNANSANTFDVRRAYLGVQGKFYNDWTFDVTADFAQSTSPQLDVGWLNYGRFQGLQVRAGQFKMPFSLEELTSSRFIDFQERSLVNALVPAKERGAMLHGTPAKGLFYGAALSNGAGKNANEGNSVQDSKDVIARLGANAAEWLGNKDMVLHVAGDYSTGTIPGGSTAVAGVRTEGRGLTFFQPAAFGPGDVDRDRAGAEVSLAFGPVKAQGEYVKVTFEGQNGATRFDQDIDAWYTEVLWLITGEKYADSYRNGTYSAIKPKNNFGGGGWGAWEVGLRYTDWNAEDFPTIVGQSKKATAYTVGLKWIPNTNVRLLLNYVQTDFDTPVNVSGGTTDDEKAITVRGQIYF
jgi:phosphate-selective porin OprO/OprP